MKMILVACIACALLAAPAQSELTQQDLDKIRLIVNESEKRVKEEIKEELKPIKADIGKLQVEVAALSERVNGLDKSLNARIGGLDESLSGRIDGLDKSLSARVNGLDKMMTWIIALIVAAVAIPQTIMVWRSRRDAALEKRMEEMVRQNLKMAEDIEILKQQRIARS